jgi:hypothetical protein
MNALSILNANRERPLVWVNPTLPAPAPGRSRRSGRHLSAKAVVQIGNLTVPGLEVSDNLRCRPEPDVHP